MDPTVVVAIIGAFGSIGAAYVGNRIGKKKGFEDGFDAGRQHSIENFMDEYLKSVNEALIKLDANNVAEARGAARGLVANVKIWKDIQSSFSELLNGLIAELDELLKRDDVSKLRETLIAIRSGYPGRRLAIETQLERSKI